MKKWYQSKTLWVNVLALAGMVAEYLLANHIYSPQAHAIALGAINIGLRLVTTTGIERPGTTPTA